MTLNRFLDFIERAGNRLPTPTILFIYLCALVLFLSFIAELFGVSATHPITQAEIKSVNLLSRFGLHEMLSKSVSNFTQFAPLGTVLIAILGIGIADKSGLINALLKITVARTPDKWLTFIIVLAGVLSNLAADTGYVVLIPLAALAFIGAGRNPLLGIAAAFAGVSGGYSANLLIGPVDAILAGISTEASAISGQVHEVSVAGNYYFMLASTLLVALVGTLVTEKIVGPRYTHSTTTEKSSNALSTHEKKALKWVGLFTMVFIILFLIGLLPENGILRASPGETIAQSPAIKGIVIVITIYAALCGIVYGKITGAFKRGEDISQAMDSTMQTMAGYIVLMFFAAQFVSYFSWSQLGSIIAITGANFLQFIDINSGVLLVLFVFSSALINLFIGSASAKWALLAPIFVPMFMLLGISPEATQTAFRIGDSTTNIITPLMPYYGVIIAFAQKYDKRCGIGTLAAMMLPYSIAFLICWTVMLIIWFALDIPLGPGASILLAN